MRSLRLREHRFMTLERFFEAEKKAMIKYYAEKMKKNKKLKSVCISLQAMDPSNPNKFKVLRNYYQWVVVQNNLIDGIYFCAKLRMLKS